MTLFVRPVPGCVLPPSDQNSDNLGLVLELPPERGAFRHESLEVGHGQGASFLPHFVRSLRFKIVGHAVAGHVVVVVDDS